MGVMACDRTGCDNVMCDRYSNRLGYICCECFDELVNLGITANVEEFMDTPKRVRPEQYVDARECFDKVFPLVAGFSE